MEVPISKLRDLWPPHSVLLVSTISKEGLPNVAPICMNMCASFDPPALAIGVAKQRRTHRNIVDTGEFVANTATDEMAERISMAAWKWPPGVNKFEAVGLTSVSSLKVRAPSVKECRVHFECEVRWMREAGDHDIIVGEVVAITADEQLAGLELDKIPPMMKPIYYGCRYYYTLGDFLGERRYQC